MRVQKCAVSLMPLAMLFTIIANATSAHDKTGMERKIETGSGNRFSQIFQFVDINFIATDSFQSNIEIKLCLGQNDHGHEIMKIFMIIIDGYDM